MLHANEMGVADADVTLPNTGPERIWRVRAFVNPSRAFTEL